MKRFIVFVVVAFCSAGSINCAPARIKDETFFHPLIACDVTVDVTGFEIWRTFCLTENVVLAFGEGDPALGRLFLFDNKKMRTIYESEPDAPPYEWRVHQLKLDNHIIVLWEIGTEFCSVLKCYDFDVNKKHFTFVGKFDVALPQHGDPEEYNSYPVDQIGILPSDTLVTFRFPHRLLLRPYEEDAQEVDSLIYELNLHTNVMSRTSWPGDTLR